MFYKYHNHYCLKFVGKGTWLSDCGLPTQLLSIPSVLIGILGIPIFSIGLLINSVMNMNYGIIMMSVFTTYYIFFLINVAIRKYWYLWKHPWC